MAEPNTRADDCLIILVKPGVKAVTRINKNGVTITSPRDSPLKPTPTISPEQWSYTIERVPIHYRLPNSP